MKRLLGEDWRLFFAVMVPLWAIAAVAVTLVTNAYGGGC